MDGLSMFQKLGLRVVWLKNTEFEPVYNSHKIRAVSGSQSNRQHLSYSKTSSSITNSPRRLLPAGGAASHPANIIVGGEIELPQPSSSLSAIGDCMENDGESSYNKRSQGSGECSDDDACIYDYEYNNSDDDCIYEYDYNDNDGDEYMNAAEETEVHAAPPPPYVVLTESDVLSRQAADTAATAEILSIPPAFATILLRRYRWITSNLQEDWFSDDRRVRSAGGLPENGSSIAMALSSSPLICKICFDMFPAGETRSAGCVAHFYCDDCWRGYIHAAVGDGPRCLSLRCPHPSCSAAIAGDLVDAVAGDEDRQRYAMFALRSYVEESGGGRIKWCPGAGCTRAVEFVGVLAGDDEDDITDVFCSCRHGFCWR